MNLRFAKIATPASSSIISVIAASSLLLCGCTPDAPLKDVSPKSGSSPFVTDRLNELNRIGAKPVATRTYQFESDGKCAISVTNRANGDLQATVQIELEQLTTKVIPYATGDAFGLKGYLAGQGSSLDLLDSKDETGARRAAVLLDELKAHCLGK